MKTIEAWLVRRSTALIGILAVAIVILTAATTVFIFRSEDTRTDVQRSPCFQSGAEAAQRCKKQQAETLLSQPHRVVCAFVRRANLDCLRRPDGRPAASQHEGGDSHSSPPPQATQQPSPPSTDGGGSGDSTSGGSPGNSGGDGNSGSPPNPPPPAQEPNVVDQVTQDVTDTACDVAPVSLPICD